MTLIAVVGVVSVVAVAAFANRLGLAAPLALVIVGLGLSFVPGVPHPQIAPEWILAGVLPPLLYASAVTIPVVDFRRNIRVISSLAILLVVLTTLGTGWLFHLLLPGIGWPAAFALGAVISPTDAVAATAMGRKLGLPHRLLVVLEGEGLVNDASALVLLRSATAALAASVSVWGVVGEFLYAVVVAAAVGLAVGVVNVRLRALLKDPVLNTAISFVVPFLAYLPAEALGASGVLAVVVAGLVTGHEGPRFLRAQDRIAEDTNWRTLAFLLESGLFLLMGLSVEGLLADAGDAGVSAGRTAAVAMAAVGLGLALRMVFVAPIVTGLRRRQGRAADLQPRLERLRTDFDELVRQGRVGERKQRRLEHRITRAAATVQFELNETLGWRGGVVLAWAGMRGAITVAAAQTLPPETPLRSHLILIAFVVAATTLLLQGLTLPTVIRAAKVPGDDMDRLRADYLELGGELDAAALSVLDDPGLATPDGGRYEPQVVEQVRADSRIPSEKKKRLAGQPGAAIADLRDQYVQLRLRVLDAEVARLLEARDIGLYSTQALDRAQHMLDVDAARLQQLDDATGTG
nr:sodium:proton antiporter [Streptomyces coryli]